MSPWAEIDVRVRMRIGRGKRARHERQRRDAERDRAFGFGDGDPGRRATDRVRAESQARAGSAGCRKRAYPDRDTAQRSLVTIATRGSLDSSGKIPTRAYECPRCAQWHLTHLPEWNGGRRRG